MIDDEDFNAPPARKVNNCDFGQSFLFFNTYLPE